MIFEESFNSFGFVLRSLKSEYMTYRAAVTG
jgi:hypothetical protein